MPDPWDIPPFPTQGDPNEDMTYRAVGHALSRWEAVEVQLAMLYSVFSGRPYELEGVKAYGEPRIFVERAGALMDAATNFFVSRPNQCDEGSFKWLHDMAFGWSARRNDLAHGIVRQTSQIPQYRADFERTGKLRYVLVPSIYKYRSRDSDHTPIYCYSSIEMDNIAVALADLAFELEAYRCLHFPDAGD